MSSAQTPSGIFEEIATLFSSAPSTTDILEFHPSEKVIKRAVELLEQNRQGNLSEKLIQELDQYEQAELLMRLVKARIRSGRNQDTTHRE